MVNNKADCKKNLIEWTAKLNISFSIEWFILKGMWSCKKVVYDCEMSS